MTYPIEDGEGRQLEADYHYNDVDGLIIEEVREFTGNRWVPLEGEESRKVARWLHEEEGDRMIDRWARNPGLVEQMVWGRA